VGSPSPTGCQYSVFPRISSSLQVDTIVGSVFALTGIRHGAFAINVDTRKVKGFYKDLINVLIDDAVPDVWLLRKTL